MFSLRLRRYLEGIPSGGHAAKLVQLEDPLLLSRDHQVESLSEAHLQTYALENHLVAEMNDRRLRLTPLGQTFLRLRGRDALRWLLTSEVVQSLGTSDPWHVARASLEDAIAWNGMGLFHPVALGRLIAMGILMVSSDDVRVPSDLNELVLSVLNEGPWHTAIRAALEDEREASVPGTATTTIADALVEQTRLFTHEVRNALVPVRHHLDSLSSAASTSTRSRIEAARRGVVRLLDFVEQWVTVAEAISEPPRLCDLTQIVADALAQVEGSERIVSRAPALPVQLKAPRQRLTFAIANLLRNAVQAAESPLPIEVQWMAQGTVAVLSVDDGGPGVATEDLERIFDDGFSKRPGGSGFGLAFARRFVESALRGKVWCEASPLGGARFTISLPLEPSP